MEDNLSNIPEDVNAPDQFADQHHELHRITPLTGMYENWFLDYATYVILERAVPELLDGLKPVQRRLLHAMYELEDGRYNKVANIIGHTMKYHPHGDASIGDALVQMGQKDLLIDTQGNWGNVLTGDRAAAARYIEARLSKFALDVVFNPKNTKWKPSYDGRNQEPVVLPVKFPLLLTSGVEGIAVGLASKILPNNFIELIEASIKILQNKEFEILPDFPTGGLADFSKYNKGLRGGRVRVRARINKIDKKTLVITEIPFGTTTEALIDSIIAANDKGKIKIRKIDDNTAENVEILIHLQPGISPDLTIDALYAFTGCEVSISSNICVIHEGKPQFLSVDELLKISTQNTLELLRAELQIRKDELLEQLHFASLEKIFIENRIYREIEECETWQEVITTIKNGLQPFVSNFIRAITTDDIVRLTEIKIKRISKYNSFKADEEIKKLQDELAEIQKNLDNLIEYAIEYFRRILKKYSKGKERRTEIRNFDVIEAAAVAAATQKLYVNREEGFAGTGLKKDEYVCDCSDIDDIIVFRDDGTFLVTRVTEKSFIGKGIIHIDVFKRNDERTIYNMIYRDGKNGKAFVKRYAVMGVTRDKEYDLTMEKPGSKVLYFSANPNGEAEIVKIFLKPHKKLRKLNFEFDFSTLAIKGRNSKGNIISRQPVSKILKSEEGVSTLAARSIWFDDIVRRLNSDDRGKYLGEFSGDDKLIHILSSGVYFNTGYDLSLHVEEDLVHIEKYDPEKILTVIYFNGNKQDYYLKRFIPELSDRKIWLIPEEDSHLVAFSFESNPLIKVEYDPKQNKKPLEAETINAADFVEVMSVKAIGKRISRFKIKKLGFVAGRDEAKQPLVKPEIAENEEHGVLEKEPDEILASEKHEQPDIDVKEEIRDEVKQDSGAKVDEIKPDDTDEVPDIKAKPKQRKKAKAKIGEIKEETEAKQEKVKKKIDDNVSLTPPRPKGDNRQMTMDF